MKKFFMILVFAMQYSSCVGEEGSCDINSSSRNLNSITINYDSGGDLTSNFNDEIVYNNYEAYMANEDKNNIVNNFETESQGLTDSCASQ